MSLFTNCVTLDSPNLPILSTAQSADRPFGKFLPTFQADDFEGVVKDMRVRDMYLPSFSVRVFEGKIGEDAVFLNEKAEGTDLLGSCLFFKGNVRTTVSGRTDGPESYNRSQNFKFDPDNELIHYCERNAELHFMHLSYQADFFNQLLPDDQRWAEALKNRICKKERIMADRFYALTLAQQQALNNILNCPMEGKLGYMMIETSLIQVILIHVHSLFYKGEAYRQPVASRRDIDVIQHVNEHLSKTFLEDHCLNSLAKQFGTNTNKLMNLFKKLFGKSIFEFIGELRMNHAMELLRDHGLTVTEVARTVGYKNPNHFSNAFKRTFGISPSTLKSGELLSPAMV